MPQINRPAASRLSGANGPTVRPPAWCAQNQPTILERCVGVKSFSPSPCNISRSARTSHLGAFVKPYRFVRVARCYDVHTRAARNTDDTR